MSQRKTVPARPALSNTGLANRKGSFSDLVSCEMASASALVSNFDTLYCNLTCELDEGMLVWFDALRDSMRDESLQTKMPVEPQPVGLYFCGEPLYLTDFSSRRWRSQLRNELVTIQFARSGGVTDVTARIRFGSAYLHQSQPLQTLDAIQTWAYGMFGLAAVLQVSELHLCRDVSGVSVGEHWEEMNTRFVMRSRKIATKRVSREEWDTSEINKAGRMVMQTAMFGSRKGALSAELYNKLDEIKHSGKTWFLDRYKAAGWDGSSEVWRLEFRLKRDFLREVSVNTLADLAVKLDGIWSYCCDWLRHVDCAADADKDTRSRASLSSWWFVYAAPFVGELEYRAVTREQRRVFAADRLWSQSIGCLSKAMAAGVDGPALTDLGVMRAVVDRLHWYLGRKEVSWSALLQLKQRQIATGS